MSIQQGGVTTFGTNSVKTSNYTNCFNTLEAEHNKELKISFSGGADGEIYFQYKRGITYTMINKDLRLTNTTKASFIKFKIQSNNPLHYKVHPSNAEIPPEKTIDIIIQINGLEEISEIGPNFFAKFLSDKFKLTWVVYNEYQRSYMSKLSSASSVREKQNKKVYTVKIIIDDEHEKEQVIPKKPVELGERVNATLEMRKKELQRLDAQISKLQGSKLQKSCLSCGLIMMFSCLAFIAGLLLPFS